MCAFLYVHRFIPRIVYFFWCYVSFLWKTTKMHMHQCCWKPRYTQTPVSLITCNLPRCLLLRFRKLFFSIGWKGVLYLWGEFWVRGHFKSYYLYNPLTNLWTRPENTPNSSQLQICNSLKVNPWDSKEIALREICAHKQKSEPQIDPLAGVVWILGYDGCHWKRLSRDPWRWPDVVEICVVSG